MAIEDQVKVLEDEFKLIKSELRQTLISVRDFMLDIKLPPMEETDGAKKPNQVEVIDTTEPQKPPEAVIPPAVPEFPAPPQNVLPETPQVPELPEITPEPETPVEPEILEPVVEELEETEDLEELSTVDDEDTGMTSGEMPVEEEPEEPLPVVNELPKVKMEARGEAKPQVNLLANLIRWTAVAKQEIGMDQLPGFLDLYSVSGELTPEIKETILHLADIATDPVPEVRPTDRSRLVNEQITLLMEMSGMSGQIPPELKTNIRNLTESLLQQSASSNKSNVWSQMLLELHGILTGEGGDLRPLTMNKGQNEKAEKAVPPMEEGSQSKPADKNEDKSAKKKAVKPARLRLVFPVDDGSEQELDLGKLFINTDSPEENDGKSGEGNGHNEVKVN